MRIDIAEEIESDSGGARFDRICETSRQEFAEFIGKLADSHTLADPELFLDWWLGGTASRHPELSRLHRTIMQAQYIRERQGELPDGSIIVVESRALEKVTRKIISQASRSLQVRLGGTRRSRFVRLVRERLSPWRTAGRVFYDWFVVRAVSRRDTLAWSNGLILVDTFCIPGAVRKDRYYPGLMESLHPRERTRVRLVPHFHGFTPRALPLAVRELRIDASKYLFKERILTFLDVAWAVGHVLRRRRIRLNRLEFRGIPVSELVDEDLASPLPVRCAIHGLSNYRFARRLRKRGIAVSRTIDWYENHPMDRGWNRGFLEFYPEAFRVGYQGFYPSFPAARPTRAERLAGLVPDVVAVMGRNMQKDVSEFDCDLKTVDAPAFRYEKLLSGAKPNADPESSLFLVALPYDRRSSDFIVDLLVRANHAQRDFSFLVKLHPATMMSDHPVLERLVGERITVVEERLDALFGRVAAVIGGPIATSSLEAIASGRPFVSLVRPGCVHEHKAPVEMAEGMYYPCQNLERFLSALYQIAGSTRIIGFDEIQRMEIVNGFFNPVDEGFIREFLGISCSSDNDAGHSYLES